jgi:hypothetical protein
MRFVLLLCFASFWLQAHSLAQQSIVLKSSTVKSADGLGQYAISEDLQAARLSGVQTLELAMVMDGRLVELHLDAKSIYTAGARVVTSSGATYPISRSVTYVGHVLGAKNSMASLVISGRHVQGIIAYDGSTYEITTEASYYKVYQAIRPLAFAQECYDTGSKAPFKDVPTNYKMTTGDCLELYTEVDYQSYIDLGSDITNVNNWVSQIMAPIILFYDKYSIPVTVSEVFVWTTPDPYLGGNPLAALNQFISQRQNNYNGRVAQLLTTRDIGGGIAEGIGGLCGSYPQTPSPYLVAGNLDLTILPLPSYTAAVQLVAHELGHVIGARHTHACVWNGNGTQIDDCGNDHAVMVGAFPEGSACYDPQAPIPPPSGTGTIMSRCELTSATVDLSLGFDPQVGALLNAAYNAASCQTGVTCSGFIPGNDVCQRAISVPIKNACIPDEYDNILASSSGTLPAYTCGTVGVAEDVWFTTTVPASGELTIETSQIAGGLTDMVVQVYAGTCTGLTTVDCDDNSGTGDHSQVVLTGRTPEETLWVRVVDSGSDQQGAFGLCIYDDNLACHPSYDGLVALYNATNGPSWLDRNGWQAGAAGTDCDVCTWYGVTCDIQDRVVQLRLDDNNLVGSLPAAMAGLDDLQWLDLGQNNLSGSLPTWLAAQDEVIVLDLGANGMTGGIDVIASMQNLSVAHLENNAFSGSLPPSLPMGTVPTVLDFSDNNLSGCIPNSYLALCASTVDLSSNQSLSNCNFSTFCTDGFGGDFDGDGFCSGNQAGRDCLDDDPSSYPGAPELCDGYDNDCNGIADDSVSTFSIWQGGSGSWDLAGNWSPTGIPTPCTDVTVPSGSVIVDLGTSGSARSILISGGVLTIDGALDVRGSTSVGTQVTSAGQLVVNGPLKIYDSATTGLEVVGSVVQADSILVIGSGSGVHMFVAPNASISQSAGHTVLREE